VLKQHSNSSAAKEIENKKKERKRPASALDPPPPPPPPRAPEPTAYPATRLALKHPASASSGGEAALAVLQRRVRSPYNRYNPARR
jgi:hypothetical protein